MLLSFVNLNFITHRKVNIKVNNINQGMSFRGLNPSSEIIINTDTHHNI